MTQRRRLETPTTLAVAGHDTTGTDVEAEAVTSAISLAGLCKAFGPKIAVDHLDLEIPPGALVGFIGPNGAGKTTTIRMIMSIIFPDRGTLSVLGKASALESKDRIGYLPEERGLYKKMKVPAFLAFMARLKGVDGAGLEKRIAQWLDRVELGDVKRKKCEELSKGMQQKVQFIAAVLHEPDLLILDEPFSGLDPMNARLLRELIDEQHRAGKTIIFSTHQMSQAETLCDRVVMIHQGKKVLDDPPTEIRARFDPRALLIEPGNVGDAAAAARSVPGVTQASVYRGLVTAHVAAGVEAASLMAPLVLATKATRIEVLRPTLEDVFIEIVRGGQTGMDVEQMRASLRSDGELMGSSRGDRSGD